VITAVPYISQWDSDAHLSRGDCGIVAAAMVAQWKGIDTTPDAMLRMADLPIGKHSYTFAEVMRAAQSVGLTLNYHFPATWSVIREELCEGRPVVTLLRYGELLGNQDDFDGSHFLTVVGCTADDVIVNDPDWWGDRRDDGFMRHVPIPEFERAIGTALNATGNKAHQSLFIQGD
jgi:hypothetical protein